MAYQPNDFVNPNQRRVELPAGCKDLNEFLQKIGAQEHTARPLFPLQHGTLKDVPRFVQHVYLEHYGLSLVVTVRAAEAIFWVHNRHGGSRLTFLLRKQHTLLAPIIQDLFRDLGFHEEAVHGRRLVTAPLPHLWLEAAQILESLIRGCGVAQNTDLLFHFVRRQERAGTAGIPLLDC